MRIGDMYSHKDGERVIKTRHSGELKEIEDAISRLDGASALCKQSSEKTKPPLLFSPEALNGSLKEYLSRLGWTKKSSGKKGFTERRIYLGRREFREMDGIKNKVGLEIQFGKYAFMGYDIFAKMPIFAKKGLIECGIELVVMPSVVRHMSTGVSSFNQIVMDLKEKGVSDTDIPTLIIGIDCSQDEWESVEAKRRRYQKNPQAMIESGEVKRERKGAKPGPKN